VLDLHHLRTFVVMAATANFTRAAKELGCSQSTVTLHIKTLERELGALLFERSRFTKTSVLTAVGRHVFDYSVRLLAITDEMKITVQNLVAAGLAVEMKEPIPRNAPSKKASVDSADSVLTGAGTPASGVKARPFVRHSLRPRLSNS
jgi:molybdenum-dependent DNA-binding transcriptional regulator ModE